MEQSNKCRFDGDTLVRILGGRKFAALVWVFGIVVLSVAVIFYFFGRCDNWLYEQISRRVAIVDYKEARQLLSATLQLQTAFVAISLGLAQLFVGLSPIPARPYIFPGRVVYHAINWDLYAKASVFYLTIGLAVFWLLPSYAGVGGAVLLAFATVVWQMVIIIVGTKILVDPNRLAEQGIERLLFELSSLKLETQGPTRNHGMGAREHIRRLAGIATTGQKKETPTKLGEISFHEYVPQTVRELHPIESFSKWVMDLIEAERAGELEKALETYQKLLKAAKRDYPVTRNWDLDPLFQASHDWYQLAVAKNRSEAIAGSLTRQMIYTYFYAVRTGIRSSEYYASAQYYISLALSIQPALVKEKRTVISQDMKLNSDMIDYVRHQFMMLGISAERKEDDLEWSVVWKYAGGLMRSIAARQIRNARSDELSRISKALIDLYDEGQSPLSKSIAELIFELRAYVFHLWKNEAFGDGVNNTHAKKLSGALSTRQYGRDRVDATAGYTKILANKSNSLERIHSLYTDIASERSDGGAHMIGIDHDFRLYAALELLSENHSVEDAAKYAGGSAFFGTLGVEQQELLKRYAALNGLQVRIDIEKLKKHLVVVEARQSAQESLSAERIEEFYQGLLEGVRQYQVFPPSIKKLLVDQNRVRREPRESSKNTILGFGPIFLPRAMFLDVSPSGSYYVQTNAEFIDRMVRGENLRIFEEIRSKLKSREMPLPEVFAHVERIIQQQSRLPLILTNRMEFEDAFELRSLLSGGKEAARAHFFEMWDREEPSGVVVIPDIENLTVVQYNFQFPAAQYPLVKFPASNIGILNELHFQLETVDAKAAKDLKGKGVDMDELDLANQVIFKIGEDFDVRFVPDGAEYFSLSAEGII